MAFEGDMINTIKNIKNNRALRKAQQQKRKNGIESYKDKKTEYDFNSVKISDKKLNEIKLEIEKKIKKRKLIEFLASVFITILVIILFNYLIRPYIAG
ncbi:hypothetical protein [Urechidicola croceus]|uniref:Uncharacterized protein n=1 Tax=Urechidicola croceus TaxID=1850246 RepID=A0A1D8P5J5_9FLAO|nr:hypothetical protein [Urechidicola croceus]AOW19852.1 hypothetical protein LPB138_03750 [Urechidicola croceus]